VELPAGTVEGLRTELTIRAMSGMHTVEEFNNLVLRESGGQVVRFRDIGEAVEGAEYVQESVSERIELKKKVYAQLQQANPGVLIGSSTSGFKASDLQDGAVNPANIIVAHPFNPVYLLPLSEVSGSERNSEETVARTVQIMKDIGMFPLVIRKEIDAFIGNRFLEAVWREALWMLKDGVATTSEIDEAMDIPVAELDSLLRQSLTTSSLDAPINGEEGRSFLGDLIADLSIAEPLDQVERSMHHEQLGQWLSHLTDQEREVLHLRFGLEGEERHTLAEIGRKLDVSRERVRQVELKALRKLRHLTKRIPPSL